MFFTGMPVISSDLGLRGGHTNQASGWSRRRWFAAALALALALAGIPATHAADTPAPQAAPKTEACCESGACSAVCDPGCLAKSGESVLVSAGSSAQMPLPGLSADEYYGVTIWFPELRGLAEADSVTVKVSDASGEVVSKALHGGDPDLYVTLKPRKNGDGVIDFSAGMALAGKIYQLRASCAKMNLDSDSGVLVQAHPNSDWRHAQAIELGKPVFATNDERPYIPALGGPKETVRDLFAGAQWFTFTHAGPKPVLVHFLIDMLDRDVPVDVAIFKQEGDKLVHYWEGEPRHIPEQSTPFHGLYKFAPRVIRPGTYFVRTMGNHPGYILRSEVYPLPPYSDPRLAIRAGMDFLVKKGDSWHANTPRRGGVILRASNPLGETRQCIACHPTHFTTRGELIAIENGYPVKARPSFQFLVERLYNNPRPIYGDPEAAWARMISAPGSVFSRLAYMVNTFEKTISHEQRVGAIEPIGNYLQMFWKGVEEPYTDSNGNLPRVSGVQYAMHSALVFEELHKRTGNENYLALRKQMEEGILQVEPIDLIDLCWKAVALATFDKEKHSEAIGKMVEEIFSHQKEDGTWSMVFDTEVTHHDYHTGTNKLVQAPKGPDGKALYSEFQTFHAIYALAKAGVSAEDPRLAKSVQWCLSRQWPHGGWQGNADYKNFDTPFRDTQFAVMALSELYKGPGADGWESGFPAPPGDFDLNDTGAALAALDQYWNDPGAEVRPRIRKALGHQQPLVRFAAASAVGRIADPEAVSDLIKLLGDPSKMVQRGAAWALRQIATRRLVGNEEILAGLKSTDDRTRWGAARVFNQHFRFLVENQATQAALVAQLTEDPVPSIRMSAAQALWQWWYWVKSEDSKAAIEDAFVAQMAKAEHPWVRRNLIEGFHNMQDENEAYFYNSWTRQVYDETDKKKLTDGHHRVVKQQAERIGKILSEGNDLQRDAVLRSYYTFHLREPGADPALVADVPLPETFLHPEPTDRGQNTWIDGYRKYGAYDPLIMGTGAMAGIGNDHAPALYYEESGPAVANGLLAVLNNGSPMLQGAVLKALRHSVGVPADEAFSVKLISLALGNTPAKDPAEIRAMVRELLPSRITDGPETRKALAEAIRAGADPGLELAEAVLVDSRNSGIADSAEVAAALKGGFLSNPKEDAKLAYFLGSILNARSLHSDPKVAERFAEIAVSSPAALQEKAIRVLLQAPTLLAAGDAREILDEGLAKADSSTLVTLLKASASLDPKKIEDGAGVSLALGLVTNGLRHADPAVRGQAVESVRTLSKIQNNPAVLALVRELGADTDPMVQQSATALLASFDSSVTLAKQDITQLLDYRFFVEKVHPILEREGDDKSACIKCHSNHTVFRLNRPGPDGRITEEQLRQNYLAALKVVDPASPEASLILIKPTKPFEGIELPGSYLKTHGGNVRWAAKKESEDYQTILRWIRGARVESSEPVLLALAKPDSQSTPAVQTTATTGAAPSTIEAVAAELVNGLPTCPVMEGEPIDYTIHVATDEGPVFFCCAGCCKKYSENPAKYA
ncbi:MAG: HEAT repeat domain-containing protein, partial [Candidatus Omnitrophica bacterium]|nr:HEAT repeat domain-containing protein [Candidatus Omnitrophota bacterium]